MNIIYMHTHDLGAYISPNGYAPQTPNLQRLANEGVLFRNAYCLAPTCSPSRAALVTGQYPHQVGMYGLTNQGWSLYNYDEHFAKHFSDGGMHTALTGVQHVTGTTHEELAKLPYDELIDPIGEDSEKTHDRNTEIAIDFIKRDHDKPFFLNVGYTLTHHSNWDRSFVLSRESMGPLDTRNARPLSHLPDTPETRWEAAMRIRATEYFDTRVGLLLDALEETGRDKDTLLIFTTDHGPGLPGVKCNLNDQGLGVALIIRGPKGFTGGKMYDQLVTHMDLFPTMCEFMDMPTPEHLQGKSLFRLLENSDAPLHDAIYNEQGYHGNYLPLRSMRTTRYRYIRRYGEDKPRLYFNADQGESYQVLQKAGFERITMPKEQLFDVIYDPQQLVNLVDDPACADVLNEMRASLDAHMANTDDPALNDAIPEPAAERPAWSYAKQKNKGARIEYWKSKRVAIQQEDHQNYPQLTPDANSFGSLSY